MVGLEVEVEVEVEVSVMMMVMMRRGTLIQAGGLSSMADLVVFEAECRLEVEMKEVLPR